VDRLFLQAPPGVHEPDGVLHLSIARHTGVVASPDGNVGSYQNYLELRQMPHGFSGVAAYITAQYAVGRGAEARQLPGEAVSASYFTVLRARLALGRFFAGDEDAPP
jgi:hypothetical protein